MKITLINPNQPPETYNYLEMLRELQIGYLYLVNIAASKDDPGLDYIVTKFTATTASYIDRTPGIGLFNLLDTHKSVYSNIRRVCIEEIQLKVIETL